MSLGEKVANCGEIGGRLWGNRWQIVDEKMADFHRKGGRKFG